MNPSNKGPQSLDSSKDDLPKLRMIPRETAEELGRRFEREKRAMSQQRESNLDNALAPFRVGCVPYLNAAPLIRGIEEQLVYAHPSDLARRLQNNELDAALVSATEVILHDSFDVLDGIAIASLGEVKSVLLAHRRPVKEMQVVHADPASLASVQLLRILLAEMGVFPEWQPLSCYKAEALPDYALLIGDQALHLLLEPHDHGIWDLGSAWLEMTQLPFVYAVWALRSGLDNERLRRQLREAKDFGMDTIDHIIDSRTEFDRNFRKDYLGWHIHYHLGSDEKRGLAKFIDLINKHGFGPAHAPRFVV
jgi:chorismate dehydratase